MEPTKPKRGKFKYTKELLKIVVDSGMTQTEIAKRCRTHQSVVSAWQKGTRKAFLDQIEPLLKLYGHRLNRTTSRLYLVPAVPWKDSDIGRQLIGLTGKEAFNEEKFAKLEIEVFGWPPEDRYAALQDRWDKVASTSQRQHYSQGPHKIVQVEGRLVFRYTFRRLRVKAFRKDQLTLSGLPIYRWLVHQHPNDRKRLILVEQSRRILSGAGLSRVYTEADQEVRQFGAGTLADSRHHQRTQLRRVGLSEWLDSPEDAGRWASTILEPMTAEHLLKHATQHLGDPKKTHNPHDEAVLPFLLAKALVELGHDVPGVERFPPTE